MKRIIYLLLFFLLPPLSFIHAQKNKDEAPLSKGMLWEISGKGMKKKSYLLGTIHIIPAKDYYFPEYYTRCLKSTKQLVMEVNMMNLIDQLAAISMVRMKDKTLQDLYTPEEYDFIVKTLKDSFQINIDMVNQMKPIFVQQQLATSSMGSEYKSYEMELMKLGSTYHKTFGGLETLVEQMAILDSIPLQDQARMLYETLKSPQSDQTEMNMLIKHYKNQDLDSLNAYFEAEDNGLDKFEGSLLDNRNKKWIPIMINMMSKSPVFFAVGAGHLGGKNGVLQLLRNQGYTIKPIFK